MKPFTLVTLLGIRPDLIRMHRLLELLDSGQRRGGYRHLFVHSGQHFDFELDGVFYRQLKVRKPDFNLNVGQTLRRRGRTDYVSQCALLFQEVARMLDSVRPDAVLYLGDTNTVLSSLVAARSGIPVIHIEGGGRSYDWRMPEEKNRITIDHLSDLIYCYLDRYRRILVSEGVPDYRIVVVGNIIVDALKSFLPAARKTEVLEKLRLRAGKFTLCTLHREENIEDRKILSQKVRALARLSRRMPVVFPVMPRVQARLKQYSLLARLKESNIVRTPPLGFLEFLRLEDAAGLIITDSGTVQEEALLLGTPCLVTRRSTERPETLQAGATILADLDLERQAERALRMKRGWNRNVLNPMGGSPSERIYRDLLRRVHNGFFSKSRRFEMLQENRFVREAYGLGPP